MNDEKEIFLRTAESIGSRLCKEAYWYDSQCNWMGRSLDELIADNSPPSNIALSSDVYEGTSGIALFLTNLYLCTNEKEYQKTAEGAIKQALSHTKNLPSISQFGFYSGPIGISYVATKAGIIFDNPLLIDQALGIVKEIVINKSNEHLMDVISGNAGAISPLIQIYETTKDDDILNFALELGDELLSTAVKESYGWSWDNRVNGIKSLHNLTGFSHGAAGIAYALLELYSKTNKKEFKDAASKAFLYENHWFNEKEENWPDFRLSNDTKYSSPLQIKDINNFRYSVAWCHGAPGIGLSRLRSCQILKNNDHLKDCIYALNTVVKSINALNPSISKFTDFSLCHGLSGLGDILITATEILDDSKYVSLAYEIGKYGIEYHTKQGHSWPCGVNLVETPGLMTGLAGIGNFYLRLCYPNKILSPLMIMSSISSI